MMRPLTIHRGLSFRVLWKVKDGEGIPANLSGMVPEAHVRPVPDGYLLLDLKPELSAPDEILVDLKPEDTAAAPTGEFEFDVVLIHPDGFREQFQGAEKILIENPKTQIPL